MSDDLLYHGDLNAALRRMMQQGFRDRNDERLMGLREMLERLRERRRQELESRDLGGVYDDIAEQLNEVVDMEREGIERRLEEATRSGDQRRQELVEDVAEQRRRQLEQLPPDLAGKVQALQEYEFMDDAARERFEELMDQLREQLMQSYFNQLSEGMQNMTPERMAQMKDMLNELNQMLEQRERGEEPDFDGFMERHGEFFPGNPQNLDELLEQMAQSMAQMQQLMNSMSPEQRAQLFSGDDPLQFGDMPSLLDTLGDLDALENLMKSATQPGELAEVDLDRARELLGDDAAKSLDRLRELQRMLEDAGLIEQREGRLELTPRAIRAIGNKALSDLYRKLMKDRTGRHELERVGVGNEHAHDHKPYEFGDPFHLNVQETVKNAIWRSGAGTPVRLKPVYFEVERTEMLTRSATVLLLDVSLSMPMRDNFLPAKKVAMALHALITSQFPRDYFGLVSFGRVAREVKPELLPEMSWDFEWGTNMQHALLLARKQLSRQTGTKQIIMVTDGEPTAHIEGGEAYFQYPPSPITIEETLKEVMRCTRDRIRINTFMLDESYYLKSFVEQMMRVNGGRAFFTNADTRGDYVLVDFLDHRRQQQRRAS